MRRLPSPSMWRVPEADGFAKKSDVVRTKVRNRAKSRDRHALGDGGRTSTGEPWVFVLDQGHPVAEDEGFVVQPARLLVDDDRFVLQPARLQVEESQFVVQPARLQVEEARFIVQPAHLQVEGGPVRRLPRARASRGRAVRRPVSAPAGRGGPVRRLPRAHASRGRAIRRLAGARACRGGAICRPVTTPARLCARRSRALTACPGPGRPRRHRPASCPGR